MTLQEHINEALQQAQVEPSGGALLVGLSGGADSVCLLLSLHEAGFPVEALHCNFELRGVASDADEAYCRRLCREYGIPLRVRHFRTRSYAQRHHLSIEMAARELRYDWFAQEMKDRSAQAVAVAHHRDDQVETLLLNLVRGAGIHGLTGMHLVGTVPTSDADRHGTFRLLRPLLAVSRVEIEAWLRERGVSWQTDATNLDPQAALRNRLRLEVIPLLATLNPQISETLAATCRRMAEAEALYDDGVKAAVERVVQKRGGETRLSIASLLSQTSPRTVLHEVLAPLGFTSAQVAEVFAHLDGQPGRLWTSAGWRLLRDRDSLVLRPQEPTGSKPSATVLPLEGVVDVDENLRLLIRREVVTKDFRVPHDAHTACFDLEKLTLPLAVRKVDTGDTIQPFGMSGTKLVSDLLTDRKLTLFEKECTRVLLSGDRIAWVVGHRVAAGYEIDEHTRFAMIIRIC